MLINDASITGSLIVNASASFQNISVGGNIIPDTTNIRNLGSTDKFFKEIYVSTGSINFVDNGSVVAILSAGTINAIQSNTSSANDRLDAIENTTSSLNTFTASISTTNTFTSSATARLNALETTSASVDTLNTNQNNRLGSLETISASNISRISSLETTSASVDTINTTQNSRLNALETTSASVDTLNTTQNSRLNSLEEKTGSLATTGSNTFVGTQVITGSLYVTTDLIVQGSSSLQNITASAVSIGTNLINLNTANPAIRFAGLVIGDSGSVGGSGSFLYDSVQDEMIFVHRGTSTVVTSSVTLMGPETYDNVGNETYLTNNRIPKSKGNEHLVDSNISDDGTTIGLISRALSGSSATFNGTLGVGTTNPSQKLHVVGTSDSTKARFELIGTAGINEVLQIANTANYNPNRGVKMGLYVNSGSNQSQLGAEIGSAVSDTTSAYLFFSTTNSGTTTEKIRIDASGKVGIGITNPSYTLDVSGTGRFTAPSDTQENIIVKSANTGFSKINIDAVTGASSQLAFLENGGQKGVVGFRPSTGNVFLANATSDVLTITSTGAATFSDRIQITSNGGTNPVLAIRQTNDLNQGYDFETEDVSVGRLDLYGKTSGGRVQMMTWIKANGRVGIGTIAPVSSLDVGSRTDAIVLPRGTTAQRPGSSIAGMGRFNTSTTRTEFYNGSVWVNVGGNADGSTSASAAASAKAIKQVVGNPTSGVYWLQVPNVNGGNPFQCYCDFTMDGGIGYAIIFNQYFTGPETGPSHANFGSSTITTAGFDSEYQISPTAMVSNYGLTKLAVFARTGGVASGGITGASYFNWVAFTGPTTTQYNLIFTNGYNSTQFTGTFNSSDGNTGTAYFPNSHGNTGGVTQVTNGTTVNDFILYEYKQGDGTDPNHYWMVANGRSGDVYWVTNGRYGNSSGNVMYNRWGGVALY